MITYEAIRDARRPEDLFGDLSDRSDPEAAVDKAFRLLAIECHPDTHPERDDAEEVFKHLQQLAETAKRRIEAGVYGSSRSTSTVTVTTRNYSYEIGNMLAMGSACNVYEAQYARAGDAVGLIDFALVKVPRSARDNDLMENESRMIRKVLSNKDTYDEAQPYLPLPLESFQMRAAGSGRRRANAYRHRSGFYTLREILRFFPDGLGGRHTAWVFRRLAMALGFAHVNGVVHGAVTPDHILILPEEHGLMLVDWKASVEPGGTISVVDGNWRRLYPQSVFAKKPAGPDVDFHMAADCMTYVAGHKIPLPMQRFFKGCQVGRVPPAWDLKDEFDDLLERMYGPRTFVPLVVPR